MAQTSLTKAVVNGCCPRCRRGHLFEYNSWMPGKYDVQRKNCEHCNLRFELEPAFFIGARYVAYAFMVGMIVTLFFAIMILGNDPSLVVYLSIILPAIILTTPPFQRGSQILYLYLFGWVEYDPKLDKDEPDLGV